MDIFDDSTYEPHRLMYWPSVSSDGEYVYKRFDGELLNPDDYLSSVADWRNLALLPTSSRQSEIIKNDYQRQADPLAKNNVVGSFCRSFSIEDAIEKFLPDVYEPTTIENRYTYTKGESACGLVVYDGKFAYSHHATDPAATGHTLNSFDLVRVHKFGDKKDDAESYKAMCEFAFSLPEVKNEMAQNDFAESISTTTADKFPFIVTNAKGMPVVSPPLLAEYFRKNNHWFKTKEKTATSTSIKIWRFDGKIYRQLGDLQVKGILQNYIKAFGLQYIKSKDINEAYSLLLNDDTYGDIKNFNGDELVIAFENGLYHLETDELLPFDHKHLSTIMLPINWNSNAGKAKAFNKFLSDLFDGDEEKILAMKEFIGVCLTNIDGHKTKKSLFLVGPGNTGKSQLRKIVEYLIGDENCMSIDLDTLEKRFGTGMVFGKRLVSSNDLGFTDVPELKVFKQLTGGDKIMMENKFEQQFHAEFKGLLWFSMNKLPHFGGDRGKHVLDRIIILNCAKALSEEKRDSRLLEKLIAESEAIVAECLPLAKAVYERGYKFTIPSSSIVALDKYEKELSTAKAFVAERCEFIPNSKVVGIKTALFYRYYREWCAELGYLPVSAKSFVQEIAEFYGVDKDEIRTHRKTGDYYNLRFLPEVPVEFNAEYAELAT